MAISLLRKLIRNQSRYESITQKLTVSHLSTTTCGGATTSHHPLLPIPAPQTHQLFETKIENPVLLDSSIQFGIYPSFSFQQFLNPVAPFAPDFTTVSEEEDLNTIYADSVKKKRKKKMNKHKLKKLRKRLRRKTKK